MTFLEKIAARKPALNIFLRIPHPWTAELLSQLDVDALTLDLQHAMIGIETMMTMLQAIRKDKYPMVRLAANDPAHIMHTLDAGAKGIICPMVNNRREAEAFVSACFYPPAGTRSFGPVRAQLGLAGDYLKTYASELRTFAQIETKAGLDNIEAICAVENLSGLYLGPYDLSIDLGYQHLADFSDPSFMVHVDRVLTMAKKYNLLAAVHAFGEEDAVLLGKKGFDIVTPADDSGMLIQSVRERIGRVSGRLA